MNFGVPHGQPCEAAIIPCPTPRPVSPHALTARLTRTPPRFALSRHYAPQYPDSGPSTGGGDVAGGPPQPKGPGGRARTACLFQWRDVISGKIVMFEDSQAELICTLLNVGLWCVRAPSPPPFPSFPFLLSIFRKAGSFPFTFFGGFDGGGRAGWGRMILAAFRLVLRL